MKVEHSQGPTGSTRVLAKLSGDYCNKSTKNIVQEVKQETTTSRLQKDVNFLQDSSPRDACDCGVQLWVTYDDMSRAARVYQGHYYWKNPVGFATPSRILAEHGLGSWEARCSPLPLF
jgi:hypothetical protein